jgi:branched-chain amino acid transport system ATP-binding protein
LHGVDFEAAEGITALIGPNGAGKTTTLNAIAGLLPSSGGSIRFEGKELSRLPAHERVARGISLVPEGRRLFPQMTVLDNLLSGAFAERARSKVPESLEQAFQVFPVLNEKRGQLAMNLSGGEQQMLAIARGLMSRPKLLMLDEPSLGLAPMLVETVFQHISEIAARGIAILLVEQNLVEALALANLAFVLEQGTIIKQGKGSELAHDKHVREAYLGI